MKQLSVPGLVTRRLVELSKEARVSHAQGDYEASAAYETELVMLQSKVQRCRDHLRDKLHEEEPYAVALQSAQKKMDRIRISERMPIFVGGNRA